MIFRQKIALALGVPLLVLTAYFVLGTMVLPPRRARHAVQEAYRQLMAGKAQEGISPRALLQFQSIERKYGKVQSFEIKDVFVQVLGDPWGVDVEVHRQRKDCVERIGGSWAEVRGVQVIEP